MMSKGNWTREETILAFSLYCKIPFGQIDQANLQIRELALIIGRTPSAVSMKMSNFGRLDPELRSRGISGLSHGSKMDEIIWKEFFLDGENLVTEAAKILAQYRKTSVTNQIDLSDIPEGWEKENIISTRINQKFFRDVLLSTYNGTCCITGMNIPELLIASHIKPWKVSDPKTERIVPSNGLLLNAFHDKAFDKGFISINTNFEIMVSSKITSDLSTWPYQDWLTAFKGRKITLPEKFVPEKRFIEYHNDVIFKG